MKNLFYKESKTIYLLDEYTKRNVYYEHYLLHNSSTNKNTVNRLKNDVNHIIDTNLSFSQKTAVIIYFNTNLNMTEIAELLSLNKSTVSRNIKRGLKNIKKHLLVN